MIKFYIDGTAGQKDGTEVTSINPILKQKNKLTMQK